MLVIRYVAKYRESNDFGQIPVDNEVVDFQLTTISIVLTFIIKLLFCCLCVASTTKKNLLFLRHIIVMQAWCAERHICWLIKFLFTVFF